jgi:xanthine dehydrogenase small subunit
VSLESFFVAYRKTLLAPGELIASVRIPKPYAAIQRFYKVSKRKMDDISSVAGAFALDVDSAGRVTRARLAFGGVAATPIRLTTIESALVGEKLDLATMKALAVQAKSLVQPLDDHRASARYRREMVGNLLEKLAVEARQSDALQEVSQ